MNGIRYYVVWLREKKKFSWLKQRPEKRRKKEVRKT